MFSALVTHEILVIYRLPARYMDSALKFYRCNRPWLKSPLKEVHDINRVKFLGGGAPYHLNFSHASVLRINGQPEKGAPGRPGAHKYFWIDHFGRRDQVASPIASWRGSRLCGGGLRVLPERA